MAVVLLMGAAPLAVSACSTTDADADGVASTTTVEASLSAPIEGSQAGAWLQLGMTYSTIKQAVAIAAGARFAGDSLEHVGDGRIRIHLAAGIGGVDEIRRLFDAAGIGDRLELVDVEYSNTELNEAFDRVITRLKADPELTRRIVSAGIDVHANRVVIEPSNTSADSESRLAHAFEGDRMVSVTAPVDPPGSLAADAATQP